MVESFGWIELCPHSKLSGFAEHVRAGRLVASRCSSCGEQSFPPRADCPRCLGGDFEFVEIGRRGHVLSSSEIVAAPAGFEELAPYVLGVIDLDDGGRLLARFGESIAPEEIELGMEVEVLCRTIEVHASPRALYTLERAEGPSPARDTKPEG